MEKPQRCHKLEDLGTRYQVKCAINVLIDYCEWLEYKLDMLEAENAGVEAMIHWAINGGYLPKAEVEIHKASEENLT